MPEGHLANGATSGWLTAGRIAAPLAAVAGIVLVQFEPVLGWIVAISGGVACIALEISAAVIRARQRWVRDTGDGFEVTDRLGTRQIPDQDVSAVAYRS